MDYQELNLSLEKNNITEKSLDSLANCFLHVTLSYKFYWLMALIKKVAVEGVTEMPAKSLAMEMVGMAWQPVRKHQVGLGKNDGFKAIIDKLGERVQIGPETSPFEVVCSIQEHLGSNQENPQEIVRLLERLITNVPYCFLQPWTKLNREDCIAAIKQNINIFDQNCTPYVLEYRTEGRKRELWVRVNPSWATLISNNSYQLFDFAMGGLYTYVSKYNSEIQAIDYMLDWRVRSEEKQRQLFFWDNAIRGGMEYANPLCCLFKNVELKPHVYRLDHYLPTQFRESEMLWSIYPADLRADVSHTGNHYQQLGIYMKSLAYYQQMALSNFLKAGGSEDFLSRDYGDWSMGVRQLAEIPAGDFACQLMARFSAATSNTVNKFTGFKPMTEVRDDGQVTNIIHIDRNNGPITGGTSHINEQ